MGKSTSRRIYDATVEADISFSEREKILKDLQVVEPLRRGLKIISEALEIRLRINRIRCYRVRSAHDEIETDAKNPINHHPRIHF